MKAIRDCNSNVVTDKGKIAQYDTFLGIVFDYTEIERVKLSVDWLDIEKAPEVWMTIYHHDVDVRVLYVRNRIDATQDYIRVSYPSHKDGHFVEFKCKNWKEAVRVFEFAINLLCDVKAALHTVI